MRSRLFGPGLAGFPPDAQYLPTGCVHLILDEYAQLDRRPSALQDEQGICGRIADGDKLHSVPAVPGVKVGDTPGAGDLFPSGFLFGYSLGMPLKRAAELGVMAAAEVISHLGARPQTSLAALAEGVLSG